MPRMKDCPECKANDIPRDQWDYANDGPYPVFTKREQRKEHSWCGIRTGGGAHGLRLMLVRRHGQWEYASNLIHNGRKS